MINPKLPSDKAGAALHEVPGYQIIACLSEEVAFKRFRAKNLLDDSPIMLKVLNQPRPTNKNYLAKPS